MGRGLTRSRSKTRLTQKEKLGAEKRKRSLSKIRAKLEKAGEGADFAASDDEYEDEEYELVEESIENAEVVEKYKHAARFTQQALELVAGRCVVGASVRALCTAGDECIEEGCKGVFSKAKDGDGMQVYRGVAVPTNVSVNDVVAHFRPAAAGEDVTLRKGDVVKIHCGCHVDGYIAQAAHTVAVGGAAGAAADVIAAAYQSAEVALRLMRPDMETQNGRVTDAFGMVAADYGAAVCEGVLSHRVRRWVIDGPSCIISARVSEDDAFQDVEECSFGANQVWHIDVAMMSRVEDRRPRLHRAECPTMLWKRNDIKNIPRIKAAHYVLRQVRERFVSMPFSVSSFADVAKARLGLVELQRYDMVDPLPALKVKAKEVCARVCWTVMLTPRGVVRLAGLPLAKDVKPAKSLRNTVMRETMGTGLQCADALRRTRKGKKKKKGAAARAAAAAAAAAAGGGAPAAAQPTKRARLRAAAKAAGMDED